MPVAEMETDVAKKKDAKAPVPPPEPSNRKPMIVQIRGSEAYKAWAESIAEREGDTLAKLFDRGVRLIAETKGYPPAPKR